MKKIKKAIFPVAGFGTRFLPATKATPKEMLAIVDKPLIQYAVEEAVEAGITELIFVTNSNKRAIEDHFDRNFELEHHLIEQNKLALLAQVKHIVPHGVKCIYIRQPEPLGLGHAIACAAELIDSPFAVILADDLIHASPGCLRQMVMRFNETGHYSIAVQWVERNQTDRYGIVSVGDTYRIHSVVEKPSTAMAPSQWGIVGRYILPTALFDVLENTQPNSGNEIQLTDAIGVLLSDYPFEAFRFKGIRYDCGNKLEYLKAMLHYGMEHVEVGAEFKNYLRNMIEI